ncbi:MAG TPA: hypothetical protein VJR04_03080 [Terriglobales bacterium]|nr:hypothetical protein [Terriglobales bacterium]
MTGWEIFWTVWLVISGASFALITAVVTALGLRDLKAMFRSLERQPEDE